MFQCLAEQLSIMNELGTMNGENRMFEMDTPEIASTKLDFPGKFLRRL
jgi:hypothetical protein